MKHNSQDDKNKRIDKVMDETRNKHGSGIITFAALVKK
jgi:hypothetical protein